MNMLEYQKKILQKVSFSKDLFIREFNKTLNWITGNEIKDFINWVNQTFGSIYSNEISSATKQLQLNPVSGKSRKNTEQ